MSIENQQALIEIFERTVQDLVKANNDHRLDHDGAIKFSMMFVEKIIPKILNCYEGNALEDKRKGIAFQLRVIISAIMPFDKFMEYMNLKEMKAVDAIVKALEEGGAFDFDDGPLNDLFKTPEKAPDIYK